MSTIINDQNLVDYNFILNFSYVKMTFSGDQVRKWRYDIWFITDYANLFYVFFMLRMWEDNFLSSCLTTRIIMLGRRRR